MKKVRCYTYTRVSTAMQVDGYSLNAQREKLHKYAEYQNMQIVEEFTDEGKSGKNVAGRLAFQDMLSKIESRVDNVSYVLVFKLSRFGRNAADVLNSLQTMQDNGVNLICVEDGIDSSKDSGKLMISVLSAVAEIERENILVQTMEGRKQKARQGEWNGGFAPFGYRLIDKKLIVDNNEAEIVRLIFEKFTTTTMGMNAVASYLNRHGYRKAKRQNNHFETFTVSFIKRVLDNPVYVGKIAYGRRKNERKAGTRGEYHIVKQNDYMLFDGIHEAIISNDVWETAQRKRKQTGNANLKTHSLEHEHILSSILKCPMCGSPMYGNVNRKKNKSGEYYRDYFYYVCKHNRTEDGVTCNYKKQWGENIINSAVEQFISQLIKNPKFKNALNKKISSEIDVSEIEKEIETLNKRKKQLIGAKSQLGQKMDCLDIDDRFYNQKYADMEERLDNIYVEIESIDNSLETLNQHIINIQQDKLSFESVYRILEHFDKFYDKLTDKEKKQFMRAFIERIDIFPEQQKNGRILKSIKFRFPVWYGEESYSSFSWDKESSVECVVLLSQLPDEHINIEINLDELDLTSAECKATYSQIKDYVKAHTGLTVSSLNIAQVKNKRGIIERENYNKAKTEEPKQPNCTPEKEQAILDAFQYFKMI